jgi:hypothetical protein
MTRNRWVCTPIWMSREALLDSWTERAWSTLRCGESGNRTRTDGPDCRWLLCSSKSMDFGVARNEIGLEIPIFWLVECDMRPSGCFSLILILRILSRLKIWKMLNFWKFDSIKKDNYFIRFRISVCMNSSLFLSERVKLGIKIESSWSLRKFEASDKSVRNRCRTCSKSSLTLKEAIFICK